MSTRYSTARRWRGLILGLFLGAIVIGCATPTQRYRVLSFFFDGVPDPEALAAARDNTRRVGASGRPVFVHKPYADKNCDACHENTSDIFARARVRGDVCLDCHGSTLTQYPVMHGPVSAARCTHCHSAHQSMQAHLLKTPTPKLCVQCHESHTLGSTPPEHRDPKSDCISCHSGHGGNDRNFVKALSPGLEPRALPDEPGGGP